MLILKRSHEFQKVLKKGTSYNGSLLKVYTIKNGKGFNCIGFAVGKKVTKSSVKRNRIRRLMKETYRINENKLNNGFNIVIVWKTNCSFELANFHDIQNDLLHCFKKANIIKTNDLIKEEDS